MTAGLRPHWSEIIRAWAVRQPSVLEVHAFGSRVKGGYPPDSDLDLAVAVDGADEGEKLGNWIFLEPRWTAELQAMLLVSVHLHCMMPDDMVVAPAIREHGLIIYQAGNV